MARNKKIYFWLKIDKNFYSNLAIKQARKIPGGDTMIIIYQRLMLESLSSHGVLYYEGTLQTLEKELALLLEETEDNIKMTLSYFVNAKLIQLDDEHNAEMLQVPALLMQETDWAKYKRNQRNQKKLDNVQQLSNNGPIDIDIEIDTDIKLDKELEIDKELQLDNKEERFIDVVANNLGRGLVPFEYDLLNDYLINRKVSKDLFIEAVKIAVANNVRKFNYICRILDNWIDQGIKTPEQALQAQMDFKAKKANRGYNNSETRPSNVPEWTKEEYRTEATAEELEELEKLKKRMTGKE